MSGGEYDPQPDDVIVFPAAPMENVRSIRYVVIGAGGGQVTFRVEDEGRNGLGPYTYPIEKLRKLGIQKVTEPVTVEEA